MRETALTSVLSHSLSSLSLPQNVSHLLVAETVGDKNLVTNGQQIVFTDSKGM